MSLLLTEILFVFATTFEAAPFIEDPRFEHHLITGMGPEAVESALNAHPRPYQEIWNIGFAGALSPKLPFGEVYTIEKVGSYTEEKVFHLEGGEKRLITFKEPLHDPQLRDQLASDWDLVDMEGHAVAHFAQKMGVPCRLIKVVSDHADGNTSATIRANYQMLRNTLYDYLKLIQKF